MFGGLSKLFSRAAANHGDDVCPNPIQSNRHITNPYLLYYRRYTKTTTTGAAQRQSFEDYG